jgi:hypothetical protein
VSQHHQRPSHRKSMLLHHGANHIQHPVRSENEPRVRLVRLKSEYNLGDEIFTH